MKIINPIDKDKVTETPGILPYAHHVGSLPINPENMDGFKKRGIDNVNREILDRLKHLKDEYDKIMEEINWNEKVYKSKIMFQPLVGEVYYLYESNKGETFLSIISPEEWKQPNYIGSFKLNSELKWEKQ